MYEDRILMVPISSLLAEFTHIWFYVLLVLFFENVAGFFVICNLTFVMSLINVHITVCNQLFKYQCKYFVSFMASVLFRVSLIVKYYICQQTGSGGFDKDKCFPLCRLNRLTYSKMKRSWDTMW